MQTRVHQKGKKQSYLYVLMDSELVITSQGKKDARLIIGSTVKMPAQYTQEGKVVNSMLGYAEEGIDNTTEN